MISVAGFALPVLNRHEAPVKPLMGVKISRHFFMAIQAQRILHFFFKSRMALGAFLLIFSVRFNQGAGHHRPLDRIFV